MPGLTSISTLFAGAVALVGYLACVALTQALRAYSRSRLEELCEKRGRPERANEIARDDEVTERAAELWALALGLAVVIVLGLRARAGAGIDSTAVWILALGSIGHMLAGMLGRVYAEPIIDGAWRMARLARHAAAPFLLVIRVLESRIERRFRKGAAATARPQSVEVEIHSRTEDEDEEIEEELPESTREMLERAVSLVDRDVGSLMTPRSNVVLMPENIAAREAAESFVRTGLSRIPLYGEHRDDIVGILYMKDLIPCLLEEGCNQTFQARKLARPPFFVPETKVASELLEELRHMRVQVAIVLDEFGSIAGLITLEDLLEAIVGPIDDEHDTPTPHDPVVDMGEGVYEVDAAVPLEELNDRLGLGLPTDGDFQSVGGLAFDALGRVPEKGATFQSAGAEFTVLEVAEHAIRRLRIELKPSTQAVEG